MEVYLELNFNLFLLDNVCKLSAARMLFVNQKQSQTKIHLNSHEYKSIFLLFFTFIHSQMQIPIPYLLQLNPILFFHLCSLPATSCSKHKQIFRFNIDSADKDFFPADRSQFTSFRFCKYLIINLLSLLRVTFHYSEITRDS